MIRDSIRRYYLMRKYALIISLCLLTGCVTVDRQIGKEFIDPLAAKKGMTKVSFMKIMGEEVVVGYDFRKGQDKAPDTVTIKNPYRQEVYQAPNIVFEVLYYFTHIRQSDDEVTDDELTPFIFHEDKLVGQGWYVLNKTIARYRLEKRIENTVENKENVPDVSE